MQISNLKKYFIIIVMALFCSIASVFAENIFDPQLSRIENEIWGVKYQADSDELRLERIEKKVFGVTYPKLDSEKRIDKITKSLGLETLEDEKKSVSELYIPEKAGDGAEYPIVDNLENTLLGSVYKTDDINLRLERLENKVFGTKQTGDLQARTESLQKYITGASSQTTYYQSYDPNYSPDSSETKLQLAALENMIYGTDFSKDSMDSRLTRLESKIFQRNFAEDDANMRIQRIQAAATANKTTKYYDSNKFQKFTSTGMQIGSFILMILAFIL